LPEGIELVEGDIREPQLELFEGIKPTACYHLAAQADVRVSVSRPDHDARINVIGTINLLEAAREHGTQIVFSSTGGAIYGECEKPATEDSPRQPLAPYGTSKLAGEEYLTTYNRLHETRHVTLRYGNVYGPRQDPHGEAGVVAIFFNRLLGGETPKIFGEGTQTRDYVYISDVVRATLAATQKHGGVYNIGTGRETSVVELFDLCRRVAGKDDVEAEFAPPRPGELQRSVLDISRAVDELGWRPERSLEEGLRETWEWMSG
jgi:UDP-glucose 4-epimerase